MYALNCPRGVSGFSLSVLLLYVCTASLCLSYFLPGLYYFSMSVTGYMICLWHLTSYLVCIACIRMSPSICSLRLPLPVALTALLYVALCMPWNALVAFLASLCLSCSSMYVLILYVCHRLYDLSVCLVVSLASFCRYFLFCSFPMSVNVCMIYLGACYMLPYVLPRTVLVVSMASLCLY